MANNYFQFKEFRIDQGNCAMKVCTDACIFGAWVAEILNNKSPIPESNSILDIGAGTGLLSLMVAQKTSGKVEAVEIDQPAFEQCQCNFSQSSFSERITAHHHDIQLFAKKQTKQFDVIISNPPFFTNSLKTTQSNKNKARHDTSLTLTGLLDSAKTLLSENGAFFVLLPFYENKVLLDLAQKVGLYENRRLEIFNQKGKPIFRVVSELRFNEGNEKPAKQELVIRDGNNDYSKDFINLLKDYYLYL